jgi:phosphatidylserine synthase
MKLSSAHLAGTIAAAYVVIVLGGILLHFFNTGDLSTLWYSLTLPATIAAVCLASLVAWGLWSRYAWAWWLGLVAVVYQLYRMSNWFIARLHDGHAPTASWIIAGLLIAFLCLLLTRGARRACTR